MGGTLFRSFKIIGTYYYVDVSRATDLKYSLNASVLISGLPVITFMASVQGLDAPSFSMEYSFLPASLLPEKRDAMLAITRRDLQALLQA